MSMSVPRSCVLLGTSSNKRNLAVLSCIFSIILLSSRTFCLSASFPKSTLQYWSSVYQQRGLEFHVDGASFDMKYILKLVPYDDGLVRRPRTDWLVASLQGEVLDILAYTCTKSKEEELDMVCG